MFPFLCYQSCETFLHAIISPLTPGQRTVFVLQAKVYAISKVHFVTDPHVEPCAMFVYCPGPHCCGQAQTPVLQAVLLTAQGREASVTWCLCRQWFRCGWTGSEQGKSPQEACQFWLYLQGIVLQPFLMQTLLTAWRMTGSAAAALANTLGKQGVSSCLNTWYQEGCCQQLTEPV